MIGVLRRRAATHNSLPRPWPIHALGLALLGALGLHGTGSAQVPASWSSAGGGNTYNSHAYLSPNSNVGSPTQLIPSTVGQLALKWSFPTSGDISATPAVEPGGLYVPDWGGQFYKIDPDTGTLIWKHAVCDYTKSCNGISNSTSRSSPAIGTNVVVIGDYSYHPEMTNYGSRVIGVNKTTGQLAWTTIVNTTSKYGTVLGSAVIYNNIVYVGTASGDEGRAGALPGYIPTFQGNVTALNADTGAIIWQFTTVPPGYAGGPLPGSNMVVWPAQNSLIVSTGNNYYIPESVRACIAAAGTNTSAQFACMDPTNYVDAILALDLTTGQLKWSRRMLGADTWNEACELNPPGPNCQTPIGRDADFAQMPMLAYMPNFIGVPDDRGGTSASYIIGDGQKSSMFFALNPLNGGLFWSTMIGIGGMEWGSAVNTADHDSFFVALHNPTLTKQTIAGQVGSGPMTWNAGAWGSLDTRTGAIKWMVPTVGSDLVNPTQGAIAPGCMTFANRLVFAGSSSGVMVALDAKTGATRWSFQSGGTVVSCPAIYNESVYWGTGYARIGVGKHMLYAFSVPAPVANH